MIKYIFPYLAIIALFWNFELCHIGKINRHIIYLTVMDGALFVLASLYIIENIFSKYRIIISDTEFKKFNFLSFLVIGALTLSTVRGILIHQVEIPILAFFQIMLFALLYFLAYFSSKSFNNKSSVCCFINFFIAAIYAICLYSLSSIFFFKNRFLFQVCHFSADYKPVYNAVFFSLIFFFTLGFMTEER